MAVKSRRRILVCIRPDVEDHRHLATREPSIHGSNDNGERRKVHLAADTATTDLCAEEFASSSDGDSPVLRDPPDQIPEDEDIGTVTADGAYDTRRRRAAIMNLQATAIIPIRRNGRPWKEVCPTAIARNETLRARLHYGRVRRAYAFGAVTIHRIVACRPSSLGTRSVSLWNRCTGYHVRRRIEAKMRCLKAFCERIAARHPDS